MNDHSIVSAEQRIHHVTPDNPAGSSWVNVSVNINQKKLTWLEQQELLRSPRGRIGVTELR